MTLYYKVAAQTPFNQSIITYSHQGEPLCRGTLVVVPLGSRSIEACVLQETTELDTDAKKIKAIKEIIPGFTVKEDDLKLYEWMAQYYHYPLGMLIFDTIPKILKRPRKLNFIQGENLTDSFELNEEQLNCFNGIVNLGLNHFQKSLIHGITGAGKTIVYLKLIKKVLSEGRSVLFLLPEINLTPQFITVFSKYLNVPIYQYNSAISNSDKYGLWALLENDESPKMVIGVRSSIFLPIKNLGLVVVDEEHDQSFKQDDRCTYNARDIAIKKASLLNIPVILGSATPLVETYKAHVDTKNYFVLKKRAQTASLPEVNLVDMRGKLASETQRLIWPLSEESVFKIKAALEKKEQVLVFINKLGYASYLQCNSCGHQFHCPNCTTHLKFFKRRSELSCQTCDYKDKAPEMCPECMNLNLTPKGFGTEKVHEVLKDIFKDKKIERFDRDEIKNFTQLEETLNDFHQKKIDILVGTQMLSKGHNFENVNLVVVLGIDSQLNFPDFRSNERVYQTLTQVSGRAGRFGKKAEVLIHTLSPENNIFSYLIKPTFDEFYLDELTFRRQCSSPPYNKIIMIYFYGTKQDEVIQMSLQQTKLLEHLCSLHFKEVEVLGPKPSTIEKKVNKFTWSVMIRSLNLNQLHNCLKSFEANYPQKSPISLKIDVDPYYFD